MKSKMFLSAAIFSLLGSHALAQTSYEYAPVIQSTPVYKLIEFSEPSEQCWEEEIIIERSSRGRSNTPVLVSTILGGALGNAVGSNKSNQRVGAVVGAVLGHSIGRDIVRNNRSSQQTVEVVERCKTVYEEVVEEQLVGYEVVYLYDGVERSIRTDSDPGDQIKIRIAVEPVL